MLPLSEGSINRQLLKLGAPLLIGSLFQQLYNATDSIVIGKWLGQTAFAASGLSAVLINVCIFLLTGCCGGTAILLANIYGTKDLPRFRQEFYLSSLLGIGFAFLLTVLGWYLLPTALTAMQTPEEAKSLALSYLHIILGGLAVTFAYNYLASVLRAVGDTQRALYFLIIANVLNTVLDIIFIGALNSGVCGAAWATVISQGIAALLCWNLIRRRYSELIPTGKDCSFDQKLWKLTLYYTSISALQASLLCIGNLFVQRGVNTLGLSGMAAFTAVSRLEGFAKAFAAAGAVALSIFIAHNEGAQHPERSQKSFSQGLIYLSGLGLFLGSLMYLFDASLMRLFLKSDSHQALEMGAAYLRSIAFFYWMPFLANAFQGWFRGHGWLWIPFAGTALQLTIRASLVLHLLPQATLGAVAWCTVAGWILLLSFQGITYAVQQITLRNKKALPQG